MDISKPSDEKNPSPTLSVIQEGTIEIRDSEVFVQSQVTIDLAGGLGATRHDEMAT